MKDSLEWTRRGNQENVHGTHVVQVVPLQLLATVHPLLPQNGHEPLHRANPTHRSTTKEDGEHKKNTRKVLLKQTEHDLGDAI